MLLHGGSPLIAPRPAPLAPPRTSRRGILDGRRTRLGARWRSVYQTSNGRGDRVGARLQQAIRTPASQRDTLTPFRPTLRDGSRAHSASRVDWHVDWLRNLELVFSPTPSSSHCWTRSRERSRPTCRLMGGQVKVKSRNSLKEGQRAVADCMYKTPTTGVLLIYLINYTNTIIIIE